MEKLTPGRYQGLCHERKELMVVYRDCVVAESLNEEAQFLPTLLNCRYASECNYFKEHHKCELED